MSDDIKDLLLDSDDSGKSKLSRAESLAKAREAKAEKKKEETKEVESRDPSKKDRKKAEMLVRRRKSMMALGPLAIPEDMLDPTLHYYWALDEGWQMGIMKQLGYDFVQDPDGSFERSDMVIRSAKFGSVVGRVADAKGTMQFLMAMPQEDWELAQEIEREEHNDKVSQKSRQVDKGTYKIKDEVERGE